MCKHVGTNADSYDASAGVDVEHTGADATTDSVQEYDGSRRRRLWELLPSAHCPVIGVCIPSALLRKTLRKVVDGERSTSDYDFHVGTVGHSRCRNPISTTVQKLLDRRFAPTIRLFHAAKSRETLADLWLQALEEGDVAGPFWAGLTHPLCTLNMQQALIYDMHLIQHQACSMIQANSKDMMALGKRNAQLTIRLEEIQARHVRQITEKSEQILGVKQALSQVQGENQAKDQKIIALTRQLTAALVDSGEPDGDSLQQERLFKMEQRQRAADKQIRDLERQLKRKTAQVDQNGRFNTITWLPRNPPLVSPKRCDSTSSPQTARQVLCVGGRPGNVSDYREIIEKTGASFAFHDGGIEDNQSLLDAELAAADVVICQTGCISHNAYWRVKDFCKRTGKRCVYVENPSKSSLIKGLTAVNQPGSAA